MGTTMGAVAQTAFDYYLDVAQYATIDEAIAQNNWTNNYLSHPYVFTRYNDEEVGWLSMTMYFAYMVSHHGTTGCMKWIDRNPTDAIHQTARGPGNVWSNTPSATNPCLGSSAYFDDAANTTSYGTTNSTNTTKQSLAFYVTNITGLVIRGYSGYNSTAYPTEIEIYICTENADGTLTARTTRSYFQRYTAQSQDINYVRLTGLDASTIYKIVCNRYRSRFLEIAFRTPIQTTPEITAEPATLNFETTVGTPVTQTFNVKGSDLEGDITATITNDNGNVFSVPATISKDDASASDGTNVTVTFSPQVAGNFTGTLTLSSTGATNVVIALTGTAIPIQPAIVAEPATLNFETTVGTPVTQTFNVKGSDLEGDITATITNDNGNVFSVPATISKDDASASDGTNVTVTFSPQVAGNFTGTLTLSSMGATDVVIALTGTIYFPVTITDAGLSTLFLNYPVKIPYEEYEPNLLGVFYIYDLVGKELKAARLEENIPAETGVIIQGNSGEYKFPYIAEADPLPSSAPNSLLSGCISPTLVANILADHPGAKIYTLGRGKDSYINFYVYGGTTLHPNKAFYLLESAGNAKSFTVSFDGDATGIQAVGADNMDGAWHNLQGIRLQGEPMGKGVFIRNGKKFVVK